MVVGVEVLIAKRAVLKVLSSLEIILFFCKMILRSEACIVANLSDPATAHNCDQHLVKILGDGVIIG